MGYLREARFEVKWTLILVRLVEFQAIVRAQALVELPVDLALVGYWPIPKLTVVVLCLAPTSRRSVLAESEARPLGLRLYLKLALKLAVRQDHLPYVQYTTNSNRPKPLADRKPPEIQSAKTPARCAWLRWRNRPERWVLAE